MTEKHVVVKARPHKPKPKATDSDLSERRPRFPLGHPIWAIVNTTFIMLFALSVIYICYDKLSENNILMITGLAAGWPILEIGKRVYRGGAKK